MDFKVSVSTSRWIAINITTSCIVQLHFLKIRKVYLKELKSSFIALMWRENSHCTAQGAISSSHCAVIFQEADDLGVLSKITENGGKKKWWQSDICIVIQFNSRGRPLLKMALNFFQGSPATGQHLFKWIPSVVVSEIVFNVFDH